MMKKKHDENVEAENKRSRRHAGIMKKLEKILYFNY